MAHRPKRNWETLELEISLAGGPSAAVDSGERLAPHMLMAQAKAGISDLKRGVYRYLGGI